LAALLAAAFLLEVAKVALLAAVEAEPDAEVALLAELVE
jgi:hypothetical protein